MKSLTILALTFTLALFAQDSFAGKRKNANKKNQPTTETGDKDKNDNQGKANSDENTKKGKSVNDSTLQGGSSSSSAPQVQNSGM